MSDWLLVSAGVVIGFSLTTLSYSEVYDTRIAECEKDLPRSQQCKLIAVKEEVQ